MDDFEPQSQKGRLSQLSSRGEAVKINRVYTRFIRSLRFILPLLALVMTVIVMTWDSAGKSSTPIKKEELIPQSENIQNELLKPVFNSMDSKKQPYSVTADRAIQNRQDPDLIELENPLANIALHDGGKIDAEAKSGLYAQKSQKLNLEGDVKIRHSNGYVLNTQELRIDMAGQKTYSGRDVLIEGPDATLQATGLEGDFNTGALIFTGPAKVVLKNLGNLSPSKTVSP